MISEQLNKWTEIKVRVKRGDWDVEVISLLKVTGISEVLRMWNTEKETESQGMNPGRHLSRKSGAKGQQWHYRDEKVPEMRGTWKEARKGQRTKDSKGRDLGGKTLLKNVSPGSPAPRGSENQGLGPQVQGIEQRESHCRGREFSGNQQVSSQGRMKEEEVVGEINTGLLRVSDLKTVFQPWMKGVSCEIRGPGECGFCNQTGCWLVSMELQNAEPRWDLGDMSLELIQRASFYRWHHGGPVGLGSWSNTFALQSYNTARRPVTETLPPE